MQHLSYALLIALSNNVDNVGARIAYSIQGIRLSNWVNLWISAITFIISSTAGFLGTAARASVGTHFASYVAMVILAAIGCWMILQPKLNGAASANVAHGKWTRILAILSRPERADMDGSRHIDFNEATLLGIALSINNVGGSLSAGMIGVNAVLIGFLSAVLSFVALYAGNRVGDIFVRGHMATKAAFVGGLLLIAIGVDQVIGWPFE